MTINADLSDDERSVLKIRSEKGKIAVPVNCALCPVKMLPAVSALVRRNLIVWIDRCDPYTWGDPPMPFPADIYLVTPDGMELCQRHGL